MYSVTLSMKDKKFHKEKNAMHLRPERVIYVVQSQPKWVSMSVRVCRFFPGGGLNLGKTGVGKIVFSRGFPTEVEKYPGSLRFLRSHEKNGLDQNLFLHMIIYELMTPRPQEAIGL